MSTPVYYVLPDYTVPEDYVQSGVYIDWKTRVIHVPRIYMNLVQTYPSTIYQLDTNQFRLDLKDIEDNVEGMAHPDTHRHNTTVTVGGVQLSRVIEIINGYTITFEDGQYAVNLTGSNNNIADKVNLNQVSVRSGNSAGLQVITQSVGGIGTVQEVKDAVWGAPTVAYTAIGTMGRKLNDLTNISANEIAESVRIELTPELSHILTLESNPGLTSQQANMLLEMYVLLGLDPTKPLIVTENARSAGPISQNIISNNTQTVVSRN